MIVISLNIIFEKHTSTPVQQFTTLSTTHNSEYRFSCSFTFTLVSFEKKNNYNINRYKSRFPSDVANNLI